MYPYMNNYNNFNQQQTKERIDSQIAQLQQMKEQISNTPVQQPTSLTQNFQIAPTNAGLIKYANTIDDVNKEMVFGDTPFFSKDMSVVWIKNSKGDIKSYELEEIIQKDERDLLITSLQMQIEELRKEVKENAKSNDKHVDESNSNEESTNVQSSRTVKKK